MTGSPTIAALALTLALFWMFGGLALRLLGALAFWAGLIGLLGTGDATEALVALVGGVAWLLGQVHYAARHGGARSALAGRVLNGMAGLVRRRDRP